jgi:hypothetical protein
LSVTDVGAGTLQLVSGEGHVADSVYVEVAVPVFVNVNVADWLVLVGLVTLDGVIVTLAPGATEFTFVVAESALSATMALSRTHPVPGGGPCVSYVKPIIAEAPAAIVCVVVPPWAVQVTYAPPQDLTIVNVADVEPVFVTV